MLVFNIVIIFALCCVVVVEGCSNLVVSAGASTDSSTIVAYNADSGGLFGSLYHYAASDHAPGTMRQIYDWDSGEYLGQIPEAEHTFNVVGNVNEFGVIIGETTFGGVSFGHQEGAIVDYGSLIWITLQRSKTAREAITTIDRLMNTYGYASSGESFSIADNYETWVMEIVGKGSVELGAVWVARKLPEGFVSGHANQARITTFPRNDPENTLYAKDVVDFARKAGIYSGTDEMFSFSDVYDPVSFSGARFCDARVWSMFSTIMGSEWSQSYLDYAQGYNLTNRMPLWVKPAAKLSVAQVMSIMRSHFENTPLDMTGNTFSDVGASFSGTPVRTHPLSWSSTAGGPGSSTNYFNERPIATQQTGWNFVAQSRRWMKRELSGLLWFGVDDSSTTVHFPIYGSALVVPESFAGKGAQDGVTPPVMTFDTKQAFHIFNLVANWVYSRWDLMYPELLNAITAREGSYFQAVTKMDEQAEIVYENSGPAAAVQLVTEFSHQLGNQLVADWNVYFGTLFVKYRDGYIYTPSSTNNNCGCSVANGPYPQRWLDRIVEDTGSHYAVPATTTTSKHDQVMTKFVSQSKYDLLQRK